MKVIKGADKEKADAMDAEGYEFKLCGGSVEPKDQKQPEGEDAKKKA